MSKDQTIGAAIFLTCIIIAVGYIAILFVPQLLITVTGLTLPMEALRFWAVATVVLIAFIGVMTIGAWIGWTMATTPPPKTIEELQAETSTTSQTEET